MKLIAMRQYKASGAVNIHIVCLQIKPQIFILNNATVMSIVTHIVFQ